MDGQEVVGRLNARALLTSTTVSHGHMATTNGSGQTGRTRPSLTSRHAFRHSAPPIRPASIPSFAFRVLCRFFVPAFIGELLFAVWLTVKGVNIARWQEKTGRSPHRCEDNPARCRRADDVDRRRPPDAARLEKFTIRPLLRTIILGLSATTAFALFEVWPRRLPRWLQRWALQVVAVGVFMPVTTVLIYVLSTPQGAPPFWENPSRMDGWTHLTFTGLLLAPWTALAAIVRQKEAFAREQRLTFALERSELERQALDARLHLLQAQVAPHFLFNTLANVQALVDTGSPHASAVLRSLTAYLRAAVPLLHESAATIERELQLVRPYLELMQMRMPDRLQYHDERRPVGAEGSLSSDHPVDAGRECRATRDRPQRRRRPDRHRHRAAWRPVCGPRHRHWRRPSTNRRTVSAPGSRLCASGCS